MRLEQFLETVQTLITVEGRRPTHPQPPREAFARPIDVHQGFCLQSPTLDEVVEAQRAVDYQDGILDYDVAMLLEQFLEQRHFEPRGAVIENERDSIRPPPDLEHQAGLPALHVRSPGAAGFGDAGRGPPTSTSRAPARNFKSAS